MGFDPISFSANLLGVRVLSYTEERLEEKIL